MTSTRAPLMMLLLVACGGSHGSAKTAAPAGPAPGTVSPTMSATAPPCAKAMPYQALCKCLLEAAETEGECSYVDDGKQPDVRLVRAGNGQGYDTYLVQRVGEDWSEVDEVYREQQHGHRESNLTSPVLTVKTIAGKQILRLEYHTSDSTRNALETREETKETTSVKVCALGPAARCPVDATATCHVTDSPMEGGDTAPATEGSSQATVDVGDDGTVTVTKLAETGVPGDCAVQATTVKLP